VDQESPYNARFGVEGYPALKIVSADGWILGEPAGREVADFVAAAEKGEKDDAAFKAKPDVRAGFVERYLGRGDAPSAQKLFDGLDAKDPSDAHFGAVKAMAGHLVQAGEGDKASAILDAAEGVFKSDAQVHAMNDLRAQMMLAKINKAVQAKDKDLAFKLLDELCDKYPDFNDFGKRRDELKKRIEAFINRK
jgi:hypothetical protein